MISPRQYKTWNAAVYAICTKTDGPLIKTVESQDCKNQVYCTVALHCIEIDR